jgi:glucose-6-phosphate dehydrogenase assembly protein OpcA
MAHFFDVPEVVAMASTFQRLEISGSDRHAMRLFAGWIISALAWKPGAPVELHETPGRPPITRVRLSNGRQELLLALASSGTCVEAAAHVAGHAGATRIVSLGDQSLTALMAEELRIRSRDLAFERALASAESLR